MTFKHHRISACFLCLICMVVSASAMAANIAPISPAWPGNVNTFIGFTVLDQKAWGHAATNGEIGVTWDIRKNDWPVSLVVDALYAKGNRFFFSGANGEETRAAFGRKYIPPGIYGELIAETWEIHAGIRKIWETHPVLRPYLGGGLLYIDTKGKVSYSTTTYVNSGNGLGGWAAAGTYFRFHNRLNIALEYRYTYATPEMDSGETIPAGGHHTRLALGMNW